MAGIITQLTRLVLTTRYQVVKMRQLKEGTPQAGIHNQNPAEGALQTKPSYPEGDLVRVYKVFRLNNKYEMPITKMDHRIDQGSDKIIKEYEDGGHPVNTDSDDQNIF